MISLSDSFRIMQTERLNKERKVISSMFDSIAPVYDRLNHILSFGIDRQWRKRLVRTVCGTGAHNVLDVACGTGDVSLALRDRGLSVTGVDISEKMLSIASGKVPGVDFMIGDASALPFPDSSFDAVTIAFGIRNFDKRAKCIEELFRVIRPGGTLAILEFSIPENRLWRMVYTWYFKRILPVIGRAVSKQDYAYSYLPESSFEFPAPDLFIKELEDGGFTGLSVRKMTGGVACLYVGRK